MSVSNMTLKIDMTCSGCALTTSGFYDLPQVAQIMLKLFANNEGNLRIYASIVQAIQSAWGDASPAPVVIPTKHR